MASRSPSAGKNVIRQSDVPRALVVSRLRGQGSASPRGAHAREARHAEQIGPGTVQMPGPID